MVLIGAAAAVVTVSLVYYVLRSNKSTEKKDDGDSTSRSIGSTTPTKATSKSLDSDKTPLVKNNGNDKENADSNKALHIKIEELDKKGKALFKGKQVRCCRRRCCCCCARGSRVCSGFAPQKTAADV